MTGPAGLGPRLERALQPAVAAAAARGWTPSALTLAILPLSGLVGALIALAPATAPVLLLLPLALGLRFLLDALAARLLRDHGAEPGGQTLLHEVAGSVSDALLYLPLALHPAVDGLWIVALVVTSLCAEVAGLDCAASGTQWRAHGVARRPRLRPVAEAR